jgi:predicted metal-dependent hydrolase
MAIKYLLKRNLRTSNLRVTIKEDGIVFVSAPMWLSVANLEDFLQRKSDWIAHKINLIKNQEAKIMLPKGKKDYLQNKEKARKIITQKTKEVCEKIGLQFTKIRIGNQKSRWGSCAKNGTLSFNYKLIYLPENLREYIIVHEVCHLKELNHSSRFWRLVDDSFPSRKECRKNLKN